MKTTLLLASLAIAAVASAAGQTYIEETFSDSNWEDRWTTSSAKENLGTFELSSGTFSPNKEYAQGLKTTQDHRFYSISTPFASVADNSQEDLIVQYTVKQEVNQECGGSYLKLLPEGFDAKGFNGDSEYAIMFGPDVCGGDNRIHVIFNYKGKNYLTKKEFPVPRDSKTHLYRLTVHPDQKYSLLIDGDAVVDHVALAEHWDVYAPRTIPDPNASKPEDWVDIKHIVDETHAKPDNYDSIPQYIADPEATQPEDWDTEADGEWEAPEIANPDFELWEPKVIDNPAYKGEWTAPLIPNPEFKEDPELAHYKIGGVGLDLWQVKSGSIFDDIVVTSDAEVADKYLSQWKTNFAAEKEIVAALDAKAGEEEAAKKAAEAAKQAEEAEAEEAEEEKDELDEETEAESADEPEAEAEEEEEEVYTESEAEAEAQAEGEDDEESLPVADKEEDVAAEETPEVVAEEAVDEAPEAVAEETVVEEALEAVEETPEAVVEETPEAVAEEVKAEDVKEQEEEVKETKHDEL